MATINSLDQQDNLYNPNTIAQESETKPWDSIFLDAIDGRFKELHTMLPAKVTSINPDGTVTIQILLKRRYADGTLKAFDPIQNVSMWTIRGADYWERPPVAVNDTGMAIFCERSLDVWSVSGGLVDPIDNRTHDLSDAVWLPGLYPMSSPMGVPSSSSPTTDYVFHNGGADFFIQKAGTFMFKNKNAEMMSLLNSLFQLVASMNESLVEATVNTVLGAVPLNNFADFEADQLSCEKLQAKFQTLVGS